MFPRAVHAGQACTGRSCPVCAHKRKVLSRIRMHTGLCMPRWKTAMAYYLEYFDYSDHSIPHLDTSAHRSQISSTKDLPSLLTFGELAMSYILDSYVGMSCHKWYNITRSSLRKAPNKKSHRCSETIQNVLAFWYCTNSNCSPIWRLMRPTEPPSHYGQRLCSKDNTNAICDRSTYVQHENSADWFHETCLSLVKWRLLLKQMRKVHFLVMTGKLSVRECLYDGWKPIVRWAKTTYEPYKEECNLTLRFYSRGFKISIAS